jgi:hypothetical protein
LLINSGCNGFFYCYYKLESGRNLLKKGNA